MSETMRLYTKIVPAYKQKVKIWLKFKGNWNPCFLILENNGNKYAVMNWQT